MRISAKNIAKTLFKEAYQNPKRVREIVQDLYFYLLQKRRKLLPLILEKLTEIEREKTKTREIEIESAHLITKEQREKIKKIFKKQRIILKEKINPEVVGGAIFRLNDTVFDGSIKSNLKRFKESL